VGRDTSFYYAFLVLPAHKRQAIVAVWDFCRAVDDAVDEAGDRDFQHAERELMRWRDELGACFEGRPPTTPQGRALAPLVETFKLDRNPFEALIEGVEMDVRPRRYETFADLYEYCIRVASAVGLICLDIFEASTAGARRYAVDLGVALQLTNILRDVPADFQQGRLYIPLEDLRAYGCTEADLAREISCSGGGIQSPAVKRLLVAQAQRAHEYYRRAASAFPRAEARRLIAAEIMSGTYKTLLERIEQRDYDVFREVVRIPRPRRALIAAGVWCRTLLKA
jgi:phytoene synthase